MSLPLFHAFFSKFFKKPEKINVLFFGLGNPGAQYLKTRHNIGFRVVETFSESLSGKSAANIENADILKGSLSKEISAAVIKPQTFMNHSGYAVKSVLEILKPLKNRFLIVVDDFNLPLGTIRARRNGTHGGHNGLKSIIEQIGTEFPRLRIGIGPLPGATSVIDFVLGNFSEHEEETLKDVFLKTHEALKLFAAEGIDAVMNNYN